MKKILVGIIIFFATFFNTNSILAEKFNQLLPTKKEEVPTIGTKKMGLTEKNPILLESKILDVPLINQMEQPQLKNGCEVTSLAMILNYRGINVTKNKLAEEINTVPIMEGNNKKGNPNIGFVGDMVNGPGLSVYNGPIFDLAKKHAGKKAVNLTNSPFVDLLKKVSNGSPVWVITTNNFDAGAKFQRWDTLQGTTFITYSEHSAVITGYDKNYIYVNDPYGFKNRKVDRDRFINAWEEMGRQAIVIQ
jgi:uncharacterized protein YvpB